MRTEGSPHERLTRDQMQRANELASQVIDRLRAENERLMREQIASDGLRRERDALARSNVALTTKLAAAEAERDRWKGSADSIARTLNDACTWSNAVEVGLRTAEAKLAAAEAELAKYRKNPLWNVRAMS